jgi:hypothetical protein
MEFFKFTGKNKALIMARNKEEAIELFEYRVAEFDDEEEIERIGETSANVIVWEADMDFDHYTMMRDAIKNKEKAQVIHVNGKIQ